MPPTRRQFLQASAAAGSASVLSRQPSVQGTLDAYSIARSHSIVREVPTPDFFEGMLLGNGDIGVCITARPDALGLHLGKSDSWDIRVSEEHDRHVLPFDELLQLWNRASEEAKRQGKPDMLFLERAIPFFKDYTATVTASYSKTWPRPWPCGIVWVHWDASRTQIVRQTLDPSCGLYSLDLTQDGRAAQINVFVHTATGALCLWSNSAIELDSIVYYPNLDPAASLPLPRIDATADPDESSFSAYQLFPATAPTAEVPQPQPSAKDSNFSLYAVVAGRWSVEGLAEAQQQLQSAPAPASDTYTNYQERPRIFLRSMSKQKLRFDLALFTPRDHPDNVGYSKTEARRLAKSSAASLFDLSNPFWRDFWSRSAVELSDKELERWWYHNQYWLACCLREGKVAPGLFGNWTSGKIGTAWHGDYHMNYNTQQVFWGVFSSNHADQHLPYIELVENLLEMSERYAREKFKLPGAFFPHSAYPVPSSVVPYPAPPWGYEICETPWVVQSLWWHYLYTGDNRILRRVYPLLKSAAQFIAAYVKRGEDGLFHVVPTVSPENWGCTVDFRLNKDCIMDLALIDFLMEAVAKASELLNQDAEERKEWTNIRSHLAGYPFARTPDGEVWLDIVGAPAGWIYNVPVTLAPVFPGERVGLHSDERQLAVARHTARTIRLEGGNDIVYLPLIQARLGILDWEIFKRQVRYCQLPNGIVNDRVRQMGGRYKDSTDFDFMMRMGVWTENLSLPAVINECLLQSYSGVIRLFPNAEKLGPARFHHLRAAGAFLVSAAWDGQKVTAVEILSERGNPIKLLGPSARDALVHRVRDGRAVPARNGYNTVEFATEPGESYSILSN